jgi:hypothetical protein
MDAQETGDNSGQGTAMASVCMQTCQTSTLQAVQWLEQYEEEITTTATEAAMGMSGRKSEQAQNRGPFVIGDSAEQGTGNAVEQGGMAATAEAADEECEAAQAAAAAVAATTDDWLYSSDEEDEGVGRRDTLEALHRMDFSMIGAVRECESTQDEGQLETGDSSRQGAARGVAATTADMIEANQQTAEQAAAAVVDKPAAGQTATDKPAATADQRAAMRAEDGGNIATEEVGQLKCLASFREENEPPDWGETVVSAFKKAAVAEEPAVDIKMAVAAVC